MGSHGDVSRFVSVVAGVDTVGISLAVAAAVVGSTVAVVDSARTVVSVDMGDTVDEDEHRVSVSALIDVGDEDNALLKTVSLLDDGYGIPNVVVVGKVGTLSAFESIQKALL